MDSTNTERLHYMEKHNRFLFLNSLFLLSVSALLFTLFFSHPFSFPHLFSSMNHFAFVPLSSFNFPNFSIPKFLFIVGNAIIIFLMGESKLSPSSPATEKCNDYVRKSSENHEFLSRMEKRVERELGMKPLTEESVEKIEKEAEEREEEEESGLETEDLNKRIEEFIARVNRKRLVEARFEDCGRG